MTEDQNINDILLSMSEYYAGSLNEAKEAIAAIYAAGMMIVSQSHHPELEPVDLDEMKRGVYEYGATGYNQAIDEIKSKYGELYAEVKE